MRVYHGSYTAIRKIDLQKCEPHRDFGRGFYVTKFREQAETWATRIGEKHGTKGVVSEFEFFESAFTDWHYRVLRFEAYNDAWLDFIVQNRNPQISGPAHGYDIVEGPVADDKVQRRIERFMAGKISRAQFLRELTFHAPTHQICFCTTRALLMVKPVADTDMADSIEDIAEPLIAALILDRNLDEMQAADIFFSSKTFAQLADEKTKLYLRPWDEIYALLNVEMGWVGSPSPL